MAKFGDKLQPASHGFHVAAECREQEITALFQAGNLVLTDAQRFRDAFLGQLVRAAQFASDTSSAMSWAARRAIFLRRAGLIALIFWFSVFIASLPSALLLFLFIHPLPDSRSFAGDDLRKHLLVPLRNHIPPI